MYIFNSDFELDVSMDEFPNRVVLILFTICNKSWMFYKSNTGKRNSVIIVIHP